MTYIKLLHVKLLNLTECETINSLPYSHIHVSSGYFKQKNCSTCLSNSQPSYHFLGNGACSQRWNVENSKKAYRNLYCSK